MKIYVTFDYELCFGSPTGSAENCLLQPTEKLINLGKAHNANFTFFVDALYLMKLQEYAAIPKLDKEYKAIKSQIKTLIDEGHDIQLHLHTHWINAKYNGDWQLDYPNFRVHSFSDNEIIEIVENSVKTLEDITKKKVFAFRAGGWCLQPFDKLIQAFNKNGIWLDSTVYHKGFSKEPMQFFDFRKSPDLDLWKFNNDPLQVDSDGKFAELPISSSRVSPFFYWKSIFYSKLFPEKHKMAGDGKTIKHSKAHHLKLLLTPTKAVVSCDGFKSSMLESAFKSHKKSSKENFVVIGHPKLQSSYSMEKLERFISNATKQGHQCISIHNAFGSN